MSTITEIVPRPAGIPKAPVYPRLVFLDTNPDVVVFATGPSESDNECFAGVVVAAPPTHNGGHKVGNYDDTFDMRRWMDFNMAVTLYNK